MVMSSNPTTNIDWRNARPPTPVAAFTREQLNNPHKKYLDEIALLKGRIATLEAALDHFKTKAQELDAEVASPGFRSTREAMQKGREIITEVAVKHGVLVGEIIGPRRDAAIMRPRFEAIARVKQEVPELSLPLIGRLFGGRDHSTIIHALRRMDLATGTPLERKKTPSPRGEHNHACKVTDEVGAQIMWLAREGMSTGKIARQLGLARTTIQAVRNGTRRRTDGTRFS